MMAPLPSRGGSFTTESGDESRRRDRKTKKTKKLVEEKPSDNGCLRKAFRGVDMVDDAVSGPVDQQVKQLHKHYQSVAQQPVQVRCDMQLTPPIARAYCPQQQRDPNPIPYYTAYAADVPLDVVHQSRMLSGFDHLLKLQECRKEQFVLSFTECPDSHQLTSLLKERKRRERRDRMERGRAREQAHT